MLYKNARTTIITELCLDQIIRNDNRALDKTFIYCYDSIGNITSVNTYAYTTGDVSGTPSTESLVYTKDRLDSYKGITISYDANGYPKSFTSLGTPNNFTWTKGKLTKYTQGSILSGMGTYTYTYDAYGRRISKKYRFTEGTQALAVYVTASSTVYTYDTSGRLIRERYTESYNDLSGNSRDIFYLYDDSGIIGAVQTYNSTTETFYFDRNIRGDVIAIYNSSGTTVARYIYDAWGNARVINLSTNNFSGYNPIRYRGYYYDTETGFYYLNARYYNPQWRRFISPDDTAYLDPETPNGLNLYAYCGNDPINYVDPSGNFLISTAVTVGFWIGLTVGVVAGATVGGIVAYNTAKENSAEGLELFGYTMLGILGGGLIGGITGSIIGSCIGYGVGLLWGTPPIAGSQGAIALWSGKGIAREAAINFARKTGAKLVSDTFAGKTLNIVSKILPKQLSHYLWGKLSAEFVAGASFATIFLLNQGVEYDSVFFQYEIWILLEKCIERIINFVGN